MHGAEFVSHLFGTYVCVAFVVHNVGSLMGKMCHSF